MANKNHEYEKVQCKVEHGKITLMNLETFKTFLDAELIYVTDVQTHNDLILHFVS